MTNKTAKQHKSASQYRTQNGQRVVVLEEAEFERLKQKADEWEPPLPEPDAKGNYPALEYARVSLARKIIRHRRQLGMTQAELAQPAGIRLATLERIEQGQHSPSVATVAKIDRVLTEAEGKKQKPA